MMKPFPVSYWHSFHSTDLKFWILAGQLIVPQIYQLLWARVCKFGFCASTWYFHSISCILWLQIKIKVFVLFSPISVWDSPHIMLKHGRNRSSRPVISPAISFSLANNVVLFKLHLNWYYLMYNHKIPKFKFNSN